MINNLSEFLTNLNNIKSFKGKMDFANQNLEKIGSGSGRVVYSIDDKSVLKLAKNPKGIAQNEVEISLGKDDYYAKGTVADVFDNADDNSWLIAEKAKKVGEKRIKQLTGIPSLNQMYYFLKNYETQNKGGRKIFGLSQELEDFFWENEFSRDIIDFMSNYNQPSGDLGKTSSYGEVVRNNQPTIVLVDYGLSDEVYSSHYSPNRKQNKIYELYNFQDGNDDILSDISNGDVIRKGMWALIPQGVEDSGDKSMYIDESFINFIIKTNKYPNKPISNLPTLADKFQECVNHISEYISLSENKKQFYNNLLTLQEYLIENHYYDRDKLLKEEYNIIDEIENEVDNQTDVQQIPKVQKWSLDDQNRALVLAKSLAEKLQLSEPKLLGGGALGFAFEINSNQILKLTSDSSEADSALKIMKSNPKHLAKTSNVYKIFDSENNLSYFALLQENVLNKPIDNFRRYNKTFDIISPNNISYNEFIDLITERSPVFENLNQIVNLLLTDNQTVNVNESVRKETYNFFVQLIEIKKELISLGIKSNDFTNPENIGYKDNTLKYFDIGGYRIDEPQLPTNSVISLPENEDNNENNNNDIIKNKLEKLHYIFDNIIGIKFEIVLNYYLGKVKELDQNISDNIKNYFKKNPKDFVLFKSIVDHVKSKLLTVNNNDGLNERILSSMKGSSTVNVKKKCKLGGLGNTSAKCNQGDIKNLDIKSLDETSVKSGEKEEIYRDNNYIVVRPLTHNAAMKYGCDTNWCTSTSNTKHFNSHTKDNNFLLYIINRNTKPELQQIRNEKIKRFNDAYNSDVWEYLDDDEKEKYLDFSRIAISVEYDDYDKYPELRVFDANDFDLYDFTGEWGSINKLPIPQTVKDAINDYLRNNLKYPDENNNTNEGIADKYVEKEFNIPDLNKEIDHKNSEKYISENSTDIDFFIQDIINMLKIGQFDEKLIRNDGDINIVSVDGEKVRNNGFVEFIGGGHYYVDLTDKQIVEKKYSRYIPEYVIWIDKFNCSEPIDREGIILHEKIERYLMKYYNYSYENAHDIANDIESKFRKITNDDNSKLIADKIFDLFVNKFNNKKKVEKTNLSEEENICKNITITPEIKEYLMKFDSDEKLLRSGGLPINLLDDAAYGFNSDSLKQLLPKQLSIKWKDDLENVIYEIQKSGLSKFEWAKRINLTEPIDVSYNGKKFYVEDGHHRYTAARILNKPLNINLEIKANPILKLGNGLGYDEFHRCIWKQAHNKVNNNNISEETNININNLNSLKSQLAEAAQKVYNEWEQDENGYCDWLGEGGICQDIAEEMCDILSNNNIECMSFSQQIGEQHVFVIAKTDDGVYSIDIPPYLYETGGGYCWKKIPDVEFDERYVVIDRLSSDPNDYENEYMIDEIKIINEDQKPISKEYIEKLWSWLKPDQRNNKLHKNWYKKALNNTLTDKEREHFMFLLKNGDSMYGKNKLSTKN